MSSQAQNPKKTVVLRRFMDFPDATPRAEYSIKRWHETALRTTRYQALEGSFVGWSRVCVLVTTFARRFRQWFRP